MRCLERTKFANDVILVASKMSSISCLFVINTMIYVNSICLNITLNNPNLRKFVAILRSNKGEILEVCPFISTKALECVMVLEKTINIYHWASQGGLVGLHAWSGFGVAAWPETMFIWQRECCLDFATSLSGLGCTCRDLRNQSVGV